MWVGGGGREKVGEYWDRVRVEGGGWWGSGWF